jgi:hypothetical protein
MLVGGVFMRSAQFGFNDAALATLEARQVPKVCESLSVGCDP